jgi:hypothetical protein
VKKGERDGGLWKKILNKEKEGDRKATGKRKRMERNDMCKWRKHKVKKFLQFRMLSRSELCIILCGGREPCQLN